MGAMGLSVLYAPLLCLCLGACIGWVLALTGAGGGALSIPILVFGLHLSVQQAAPVGLAAIFVASLAGTVLGLRQRLVGYRAAAFMGAIGMLAAPFGMILANNLPNRPLLVVFACVLCGIALRTMQRAVPRAPMVGDAPCVVNPLDQRLTFNRPCVCVLAGTGLLSGLLSGLLGVGGGFVTVPALSAYTHLTVHSIHATSLAIMMLISLSGVVSAVWHHTMVWDIALPFAGGAALAMLAGKRVVDKMDAARLKHAFAWLCVGVALLMLLRAAGLFAG